MNYPASHHGWQLPKRETLRTVASYITLTRTALSLLFALYAAVAGQEIYLLIGLITYWVGDILDGIAARHYGQEMRFGALLDIICDRLCVGVVYVIFGVFHPELMPAIALYLFQFMVLDSLLSSSFVFYKLLSPNYFYLVDEWIYKYNWTPLAKVVNSSVFILATVFFMNVYLSLFIAACNTLLKIVSLKKLSAITIPK